MLSKIALKGSHTYMEDKVTVWLIPDYAVQLLASNTKHYLNFSHALTFFRIPCFRVFVVSRQ